MLIKDWRICVIGYRDKLVDRSNWFIDNPFTMDIAEVKAQLFALHIGGGGDEPQSLLDAMYNLTQWPVAQKDATPSSTGWRHPHDAVRMVVIFTDASCHPSLEAASGLDGSVDDLIQAYHANKLKVVLFAPDAPLYAELPAMLDLEWNPVGRPDENPVQALIDYTSNTDNFRKVIKDLAKTVRSELFRARAINSQKDL